MNLPNRLTVMRIIMIPVIILIAIFPYSQFGIEIPMLQFGFVTLSCLCCSASPALLIFWMGIWHAKTI